MADRKPDRTEPPEGLLGKYDDLPAGYPRADVRPDHDNDPGAFGWWTVIELDPHEHGRLLWYWRRSAALALAETINRIAAKARADTLRSIADGLACDPEELTADAIIEHHRGMMVSRPDLAKARAEGERKGRDNGWRLCLSHIEKALGHIQPGWTERGEFDVGDIPEAHDLAIAEASRDARAEGERIGAERERAKWAGDVDADVVIVRGEHESEDT